VSLQKMLVEEPLAGSVLYRSESNPYIHTDSVLFSATEFLIEVLQHLPDPGSRLIPRAAADRAADSESPLYCTRCGSQMPILPATSDPQQALRILRHLIKTGAAPPGSDEASLG
jgi:hypothetical protein